MSESSAEKSSQNTANPLSEIAGVNPEELLARGMQSVRMTGGGSLTSWEPPAIEEVARLFPNYEVIELCGRGGMGAVYKARQTSLDRFVAIKLLPLEVSVDRDFADRFVREARTMAKLNHANIVSVFDFGKTSQGHLYFVMEYVEGTTLHQMIKTVGLQPAQALEITARVCEALNYAHSEGVVHRDIKPANVLVDIKGRVKVTDFGLARLNTSNAEQWGQTMTGMVLGTPDYMAPEQKNGAHVDHRADIYSLGVMLYEMLCGKVPQGVFDPPSQRVPVDARVDQVVIRAMQQEPDRRYRNTGEMKTDVETIRNTLELNPAFAAPPPPPRPPVPRAPVPILRPTSPPAGMPAPMPAPPPMHAAKTPEKIAAVPEKKNAAKPLLITLAACALVGAGVWFWKDQNRTAIPSPEKIAKAPSAIAPDKKEPVADLSQPTPAPIPSAAATPKPEPTPATVATSFPTTSPASSGAANPVPNPEPTTVPKTTAMPTFPVAANSTPNFPAPPIPVPAPAPETNAPPTPPPAINEWQALVDQGDRFLQKRQRREAAEAYSRALDAAEKSAAAPMEIARLCQKLAAIQTLVASSAEARGTLQRGIAAAKRAPETPEQLRLLDEMETRLHGLPRD